MHAADEAVADSSDVALPWEATVDDTDAFWSPGNPMRVTIPADVAIGLDEVAMGDGIPIAGGQVVQRGDVELFLTQLFDHVGADGAGTADD